MIRLLILFEIFIPYLNICEQEMLISDTPCSVCMFVAVPLYTDFRHSATYSVDLVSKHANINWLKFYQAYREALVSIHTYYSNIFREPLKQ